LDQPCNPYFARIRTTGESNGDVVEKERSSNQ
jgi:hypothetical protein